jgi:hypothetical protein
MTMSPRQSLFISVAVLAIAAEMPASAKTSGSVTGEVWTGGDRNGGPELARMTLKPSIRTELVNDWRLDGALRIEAAADDVGLGRRDGFAAVSRPILLGSGVRLEIDRATVTWRRDDKEIVLGKQTIPWGTLDGLQITDRFDPVRRRDFVYTDVRPDRISRWGARIRFRAAGIGIDLAVTPDATVSQLAEPGSTFEATAPRFRGGLTGGGGSLPIRVSKRGLGWADATYGIRLSHKVEEWDVTALAMSGPETDPTLSLGAGVSGAFIQTLHPRRTLLGVTAERALGPTVLRFEAAYIPDQPSNIAGLKPLERDDRSRLLIGAGVDWNAPDGWFANAQISYDRIQQAPGRPTARPDEDTTATLRLQKGFSNDTLLLRTEIIGSLSEGDGVARVSLEWRATDALSIHVGTDAAFGDQDGIFGQFGETSRVWAKVKTSF